MPLRLHNTLTRKTEIFEPREDKKVTLYTCGPTVYNYLQVGNWFGYIMWDTLVRVLKENNFIPERVLNITDVGHLVSDADEGEDKLEKGARREGKTAWEVAEFYTNDFLEGMQKLNMVLPEHTPKATKYISQQLELVRKLKEKGFTYQINDGIYFDTSKFPTYAEFAELDLAAQKAGARVEYNSQKRHASDFALWKFSPKDERRDMEWETPADLLESSPTASFSQQYLQPENEATSGPDFSPGAKPSLGKTEPSDEQEESQRVMGFPGWHLECSAMAMDILGETIDIHTGGIDHIPVHHTNEIAQSEAASGKLFARFWLHNDHLKSNGTKISKSLGNGYTLQDIEAKGFLAMDFRMFALQSQYHNESNFTWDNLSAAKNRLHNWRNIAVLRHQIHDTLRSDDDQSSDEHTVYLYAASQAILEALNDNLNTPAALAIIDDAFGKIDTESIADIHQHGLEQLLEVIDRVLGLQLLRSTPDISDKAKQLILERERAREEKNWQRSDELRDQLAEQNIELRDTSHGSIWSYKDTFMHMPA